MSRIIGRGDEEGLRKVEKDVLIMKKVKKRGFETCSKEVKGSILFPASTEKNSYVIDIYFFTKKAPSLAKVRGLTQILILLSFARD